MAKIYNLDLELDWKLVDTLNRMVRFDIEWTYRLKKGGQNLALLRSNSTIRSIASSLRIDGSTLSNELVKTTIENDVKGDHVDRDTKEIRGYYKALNFIMEENNEIEISESSLKSLHKTLLNRATEYHAQISNYESSSNAIEANLPEQNKLLISKTIRPDVTTNDGLPSLINWYNRDSETHPIIKTAIFIYELICITPFKEGNPKMSRLLSTLLLLKNGHSWIQYVSLEQEFEKRKPEYDQVLRTCRMNRPNEDISNWIHFFLSAIEEMQKQLLSKLDSSEKETKLTPKDKSILLCISDNYGASSGALALKLGIPNPTIKRHLSLLVKKGMIEKFGVGRGTSYGVV